MATTTATQKTGEEELNKLNAVMRGQVWYQQFFKDRGLDPNHVKLDSQQILSLQSLAAQNGYQLGDKMKLDSAGNINQKGGWAGMPTWAKVAIIAGATVATAGAAGAFSGGAGAASGLGGSSATGLTSGMAGAAPSLAGATTLAGGTTLAGTSAAATAPSIMSRIAGLAKNPSSLLSTGGRMISQAGQAAATNRGVALDAQLSHDQLQLAADRERRSAETDAYRKSLYGQIASGYQPSQRPDGVPSRNPAEGFITPQAREAGQTMSDIAMQHIKNQDFGVGITPFSQLPTKPGLMEQISNYAGPALSLFDPRLYDKNGQPYAR